MKVEVDVDVVVDVNGDGDGDGIRGGNAPERIVHVAVGVAVNDHVDVDGRNANDKGTEMNGPHIPINSGRDARSYMRGNDGPRDGGCWVQKRRRWFGGGPVSSPGAHHRRLGALHHRSRDQRKAEARTLRHGPSGHSIGRLIHSRKNKRAQKAGFFSRASSVGDSGERRVGGLLLGLQWSCASV